MVTSVRGELRGLDAAVVVGVIYGRRRSVVGFSVVDIWDRARVQPGRGCADERLVGEATRQGSSRLRDADAL